MKRIRNIITSLSLIVFAVSLSSFVVCAFLGYNIVLAWAGGISLIAFAVFFLTADINNATYLRYFQHS